MINYTRYIRRLTMCFNERIEELTAAQTRDSADSAYHTCYGWLDGAMMAAGCIVDSDLRSELKDEIDGWRGVLGDTYAIKLGKLCGVEGGNTHEGT